MSERWFVLVLALGGALVAVPNHSEGQTAGAARVQSPRLKLTIPSFGDADTIPLQFTCYADGGTAISPPLRWDHVPEGTGSFVLMLTGPENHRRRSHTVAFFWGRWNIPAGARELAEGQPSGVEQADGSYQMESDDGIWGYDPPCAPPGAGPIHYQYKLYALDRMLPLAADATREAVLEAMDGHILRASVYYGVLERSPPQGGQERPPPPASIAAPSIPGVIADGTMIELVETDLGRTEGPVAMRDGSMLVSSSNSILMVDSSDNVSTFIEESNRTNAMGWDRQGRLISVQRAQGNEKVGVLYPPEQVATLADSFEGRPFDALNDIALDERGGVYFTDTQGVYYLPPGGSVTRIIDEVPRPNGVVLSPDEETLYVHNKDGVYMLSFEVAPDGAISNRRNFARYDSVRVPGHADPSWDEDNGADGMAVDSEGRIYAATNVGVEIFSPDGDLLGILPVQWGAENDRIRKPQNVAFGGPDRKTLYIVGAGTIYKVRTLSQGPERPTK